MHSGVVFEIEPQVSKDESVRPERSFSVRRHCLLGFPDRLSYRMAAPNNADDSGFVVGLKKTEAARELVRP